MSLRRLPFSGYSTLPFASTSRLTTSPWRSSRDNYRNPPKSSGFPAGQARPSPDLPRAPFLHLQCALPLDPQHVQSLKYSSLYWGNSCKRGIFRLHEIAYTKDHNSYLPAKIILKAPKLYVHPYPLDFDRLSLFNGLPCELSSGLLRL